MQSFAVGAAAQQWSVANILFPDICMSLCAPGCSAHSCYALYQYHRLTSSLRCPQSDTSAVQGAMAGSQEGDQEGEEQKIQTWPRLCS